ncbi:MAG TPA: pseudouridine synthase [Candidatus Saccharimonadales bacterium]|nr:pseudouridine synthase [Candidatus Saccharimonadales bacterium]
MRINKFVAASSILSRRAADEAITAGRVLVNGQKPQPGQDITEADIVTLDNRAITPAVKTITIMLNKPPGYVVSRDGQGSKTVYDLLPPDYQLLNPVGRLDKESRGLLLLTNDGQLHQLLTHPSHEKIKLYETTIDKPLQPLHRQMIAERGFMLADGYSRLDLERMHEGDDHRWLVTLREGRNRQIRRMFSALGYTVVDLHRIQFGDYHLGDLPSGHAKAV